MNDDLCHAVTRPFLSNSPPFVLLFERQKGCDWIRPDRSFEIRLHPFFQGLLPSESFGPLATDDLRLGEGEYLVGIVCLSKSKWDTPLEHYIRAYEFVNVILVRAKSSCELWLHSNEMSQLFYTIHELLPYKPETFTFKAVTQRVEDLIYNECYQHYESLFNS